METQYASQWPDHSGKAVASLIASDPLRFRHTHLTKSLLTDAPCCKWCTRSIFLCYVFSPFDCGSSKTCLLHSADRLQAPSFKAKLFPFTSFFPLPEPQADNSNNLSIGEAKSWLDWFLSPPLTLYLSLPQGQFFPFSCLPKPCLQIRLSSVIEICQLARVSVSLVSPELQRQRSRAGTGTSQICRYSEKLGVRGIELIMSERWSCTHPRCRQRRGTARPVLEILNESSGNHFYQFGLSEFSVSLFIIMLAAAKECFIFLTYQTFS